MEDQDGGEEALEESKPVEGTSERGDYVMEGEPWDVELELPEALRDLLQRLRGGSLGGAGAVEQIPDLRDNRYGGFFSPAEGAESSSRKEVRLRVLTALGNCRTLKKFDLGELIRLGLDNQEWEAILISLQSIASQFEDIVISSVAWPWIEASTWTEANISMHLRDLIRKAHSISDLELNCNFASDISLSIATDVALGLRENEFHELKTLELYLSGGEGSEVISVIPEIVSYAPDLRNLALWKVGKVDDSARRALSTALVACTKLKHLKIWDCQEGMLCALTEATAKLFPSRSLKQLTISWCIGALEALVKLNTASITSIDLICSVAAEDVRSFSLQQWRCLGASFLRSTTLESFKFSIVVNEYGPEKKDFQHLVQGLAEFWEASQQSSMVQIHIFTVLAEGHSLTDMQYMCLQSALKHSLVHSITAGSACIDEPNFISFLDTLKTNNSVQSLDLSDSYSTSPNSWKRLFGCLRNNTFLKVLLLLNCTGLDDDNFRDLMDLLQVNLTLEKIDVWGTAWDTEGKKALLEEALRRRKNQASYISVLREAKLMFGGANAGRVFLCGSPFAGKTQLKATMMSSLSKESKSESKITKAKEKMGVLVQKMGFRRTKGIEVEMLRDDETMKLSVWDLAGQFIFRALHDLLFPRSKQTCIFAFVFSPFQVTGKKKTKKVDVNKAFDRELNTWLRFIVSNLQVQGQRPQMLVIITHKDKLKKYKSPYNPTFTKNTVLKLQKLYADYVDLCPGPSGDIFHVNAKDEDAVRPITNLLFQSMEDVLARKTHIVPTACSELISEFAKRPNEVKLNPLWTWSKFHNFCTTNIASLKAFQPTNAAGKKVLQAVAAYLHDVGTIFMTAKADVDHDSDVNDDRSDEVLIVADPNWLTQNFLGEIIAQSHHLETVQGTWIPPPRTDGDGFVHEYDLHEFITKILKVEQNAQKQVDEGLVVKLMVDLDLCYKFESEHGGSRYFMPIVLGPENCKSREKTWMNFPSFESDPNHLEKFDHFGFRIQCKDTHKTSFNSAFFPRFQIHLRKRLGALLGVTDDLFVFSHDYAAIRTSGCQIFVEIDENGENHVDVMVRSLKTITRDWAIDFIKKHILDELTTFCASPSGCPGVQLQVLILRTRCVEMLTPREFRHESQAVSSSDLTEKLKNHVEYNLKKGEVDGDILFNKLHTWPEISTLLPHHFLPCEDEEAVYLLTSQDVEEVLSSIRKDHDIHKLQQDLLQLRDTVKILDSTSSHLQLGLPYPVSWKGTFSSHSFHSRNDVTEDTNIILRGIHDLRIDMIAGFQHVTDDLKDFRSALVEMRTKMTHVSGVVDTIIGYVKSKDKHRTPRRPYFTLSDTPMAEKVRAKVLFSRSVQLHLMCEARHRPHFVEDQQGVTICYEKQGEMYKKLRTLSVVSLHMIWVLLTIGVHVTTGLSPLVPDSALLSNLSTGASLTASMALTDFVLDQLNLAESVSLLQDCRSVDEAWLCLRDYIAESLTTEKCSKLFGLHLVRYRDSDDPYAWLCGSCVVTGKKNHLLE